MASSTQSSNTIQTSSFQLIKHINSKLISQDNINKIYISFETFKEIPQYINIEAWSIPLIELIKKIVSLYDSNKKNLILIDSINYIPLNQLSKFISDLIINDSITIITTYHTSLPEFEIPYQNLSRYNLLSFISSSIIEILPNDEKSKTLKINKSCKDYRINFIHKRKSGRINSFKFEFINDEFLPFVESIENNNNNEDLLEGLTTFNLKTSSSAKVIKDNLELPYMEAQRLQESSGAIVYQFEKDDDYDEEDPYEDPF
ncbi:hypothetical protein WICMUC_000428 [Wickerhamomyces mucosus]|uniref:Elongator complex protein 5 n=1 Tax=Wickerhamomyces mucosus TaxID=1378264 RepID=A0A9P8PZ58_9ASCO|nr:hypothetical protein WICMUC_000428 [Wickerhamomyces mucosus]